MGSLGSRPKAPSVRPIVYNVPAPTYTPPATTTPESSAPTEAETQAAARSAGLLDRRRGILSTVLTGFRGVLSRDNATTPRKTLLGE